MVNDMLPFRGISLFSDRVMNIYEYYCLLPQSSLIFILDIDNYISEKAFDES